MSKVEYRFLQGVKQLKFKDQQSQQTQQNQQNQQSDSYDGTLELFDNTLYEGTETPSENNMFNDMGFDDSMYNNEAPNTYEQSTDEFGEELYKSASTQETERRNTDEFIQYNIEFNRKVSSKEARTSIESRLPFVVDKADFKSFSDQKASKKTKKSTIIRETDSIYKLQAKMRKSGLSNELERKSQERIGFVEVTKTPQLDRSFNNDSKSTRSKSKTKQLDKIVGLLNEKFIIRKKKGFNKAVVGYLPVELSEIQTLDSFNITDEEIQTGETTRAKAENITAYNDRLYKQQKLLEKEVQRNNEVQRYVEIIEDKGISRFIYIIALFIIIWFIINTLLHSSLANGWSRDGLNLIKTEEQTIETETNIAISINTTPIMKKGKLNINLSSEKVEGMTYKIEIIDKESQEIIYQSNEQLESGVSISEIEIDKSELSKSMKKVYFNTTDENIYREAMMRCETYKNNKLLGEIEQLIQIKIKPKK